ncbi:MAG: hypothetical protein HWN81_00175 [Candidatus Lokiarchaeota archaeon]|nr:hypothetical protein [Candidatus Lokiarchaeota archaeon]
MGNCKARGRNSTPKKKLSSKKSTLEVARQIVDLNNYIYELVEEYDFDDWEDYDHIECWVKYNFVNEENLGAPTKTPKIPTRDADYVNYINDRKIEVWFRESIAVFTDSAMCVYHIKELPCYHFAMHVNRDWQWWDNDDVADAYKEWLKDEAFEKAILNKK